MKNKKLALIFAILCFVASAIMFSFRNDSHLSELGDFFWVPLPLGAVLLILTLKADKK
jgi:hypothetical protein